MNDLGDAEAHPDEDNTVYYWEGDGLRFEQVSNKQAALNKPDDDDVFYYWVEA